MLQYPNHHFPFDASPGQLCVACALKKASTGNGRILVQKNVDIAIVGRQTLHVTFFGGLKVENESINRDRCALECPILLVVVVGVLGWKAWSGCTTTIDGRVLIGSATPGSTIIPGNPAHPRGQQDTDQQYQYEKENRPPIRHGARVGRRCARYGMVVVPTICGLVCWNEKSIGHYSRFMFVVLCERP